MIGRRALLAGAAMLPLPAAGAVLTTSAGVPILVGGQPIQPLATAPPTTGTTGLALVDFAPAYAKARPVVQRTARGTTSNVPVLFGWTGQQPASVQARVMQGSTVVTDWTTLTGVVMGNGTGANLGIGTLPSVPLGDHYTLQIREGVTQPTSGPLVSVGTQQWGVGVNFLLAGQSNMASTLGGDYADPVPGSSLGEGGNWEATTPGAYFDTAGWHGCGYNDGTKGPGGQSSASLYGNPAAIMRMVAAGLATKLGRPVPVGLIVWAWNSTGIEAFQPGGPRYADLFGQTGSSGTGYGMGSPRNVAPGDFEGVLWHQGEANQGDTTATYIGKLQTLFAGHLAWVAQFGRAPADFLIAPAVLGNYAVDGCPNIENIRAAQAQFCDRARAGTLSGQAAPWPGAHVGWTTIDLWRGTSVGSNPPTDTLHFQAPAVQRRSMRRVAQTILQWLGCATFDGGGPSLPGTFTRSGLVATLDVTIPSGTTLAPATTGAVTGWYANTSADFTGTDIAVTAAVSGGTKVAISFPSGTTFPVYFKHLGGRIGSTVVDANGFTASCYPDIRNVIYDTASYPSGATGTDLEALGLPLRPTAGAITIT